MRRFLLLFAALFLLIKVVALITCRHCDRRSNVSAALRFFSESRFCTIGLRSAVKATLRLILTGLKLSLRSFTVRLSVLTATLLRGTFGFLDRSFTANDKRRTFGWSVLVTLLFFHLFWCRNFCLFGSGFFFFYFLFGFFYNFRFLFFSSFLLNFFYFRLALFFHLFGCGNFRLFYGFFRFFGNGNFSRYAFLFLSRRLFLNFLFFSCRFEGFEFFF